jgi:hypothetical protein
MQLARITHGMFAKKLPEFQGSLEVHEIDTRCKTEYSLHLVCPRDRGDEIIDVVVRITKEVKEDSMRAEGKLEFWLLFLNDAAST